PPLASGGRACAASARPAVHMRATPITPLRAAKKKAAQPRTFWRRGLGEWGARPLGRAPGQCFADAAARCRASVRRLRRDAEEARGPERGVAEAPARGIFGEHRAGEAPVGRNQAIDGDAARLPALERPWREEPDEIVAVGLRQPGDARQDRRWRSRRR